MEREIKRFSRQYLTERDCDCGRPLPTKRKICPLCAWLDGEPTNSSDRLTGLIVEFLRTYNALSLQELSRLAKTTPRAMLKALQRLTKTGRISRMSVEVDGLSEGNLPWGGYWQWEYFLVSRKWKQKELESCQQA